MRKDGLNPAPRASRAVRRLQLNLVFYGHPATAGRRCLMDASLVVSLTVAAFPEAPIPTAEEMRNGHCSECADTAAAFQGKSWPDVSLDDLIAGRETALLTPVGWRYYLPAAILWSVREPEAVDVIKDNIVYQLEPADETQSEPLRLWFDERRTGFTEAQREALLAYLNWYRERQEKEYALLEMEPPPEVYAALRYWSGEAGRG